MYQPKYHYKTNSLTVLAALTALLAGGCAQSDEPAPGVEEHSVMFDAYISNAVESRAYVTDIDGLKKTGFGVFAIKTGSVDFNPDDAGGFTPDFMHNMKVRWEAAGSGANKGGAWIHSPQKKWPAGKVSFFAYAPYTDAFGPAGITGVTGSDVAGNPKLTFAVAGDVDSQIDLLYADPGKTMNLVAGKQAVQFTMKHALARVGFRCGLSNVIDAYTTVTVTGVGLRSSSLGVAGTLNLGNGKWESVMTADRTYSLTADDFIAGSNLFSRGSATDAADLTADGKYLMIIPSDKAVPVTISVKYDVVTQDRNLAGGSIKTTNEIYKTLDFNFETGKAYRLTLSLGMNSVDISAGVTGWDEIDEGWTPVEK